MNTSGLSRHLVYGRRGMVCSNSPLAASAGVKTLQDGGSAFDAALAVAAVEAVTLIPLSGLGGDSFILAYDAQSGKVTGINSSGVAASGATADYYRRQGLELMPLTGPHSISVPGEAAAWEEFHRRFCSRPFASLLEHGIGYAEEGFPVSPNLGRSLTNAVSKLSQYPTTAAIYTKNGQPYAEGDLLRNPDLARSLRLVAAGGADAFYRSPLARRMVEAINAAGGRFAEADFNNHQAEVYSPISTTYRGHTVWQTQPPSQGFMLLEMLNLVEGFDLAGLGHLSAEAIHIMVEAKKIAYADRNQMAGDPRVVDWPLAELISKPYAARRRAEINLRRASDLARPLAEVTGDTTYFCVADGAGNMVSWIHSLSNGFGSFLVAGDSGVLFNNRAGRGFSLQPGHPNEIAPGKRAMHTLNCYLATKDGQSVIAGGTPGGDLQPQVGLQILTNLLDFGLGPQEAVNAPRWFSFPGTDPDSLDRPLELRVEAAMPEETARGLETLGHRVNRRRPGSYDGIVQLIVRDPQTGVLKGASDMRGDGLAAAW